MHIWSHKGWFISTCTALWKVHGVPGPLGAHSVSQKRAAFQGQEPWFHGEKFYNWHQKYSGKQLCSKLKNKWEMCVLKRRKTNVSTPCRLLIRSFRDLHNINLCFVYCLFKQKLIQWCAIKVFSKQKKKKKKQICTQLVLESMISSMIEVCEKYHSRWQGILGVVYVCICVCGVYTLSIAFYL